MVPDDDASSAAAETLPAREAASRLCLQLGRAAGSQSPRKARRTLRTSFIDDDVDDGGQTADSVAVAVAAAAIQPASLDVH